MIGGGENEITKVKKLGVVTSNPSHIGKHDSNVTFLFKYLDLLEGVGHIVSLKGPKCYFKSIFFNYCTFAKASHKLLTISFAREREDYSTDSRVKINITARDQSDCL